uniref:Uncharacterized protein n=1 Tax=Romanomermis culicivorax TaxID=13658 RepID=A0A915I5N5_ROMCU
METGLDLQRLGCFMDVISYVDSTYTHDLHTIIRQKESSCSFNKMLNTSPVSALRSRLFNNVSILSFIILIRPKLEASLAYFKHRDHTQAT